MKDSRLLVLVGVLLFALGGWYIYDAGGDKREEAMNAKLADTIASVAIRTRDSVGSAALERDRQDSIAGAIVVAQLIHDKNVATRATNRAIAAGNALRDSITKADTVREYDGRPAPDWQARYTSLSVAFDTLVASIATERQARERERFVADSIYSTSRAKLLSGFDDYRTSVTRADSATRKAFTANIARAHGDGLRTGRIQGAGAVVALLAIGIGVAVSGK